MLKQRFIASVAIFIAGFVLSAVVGGRPLAFLSNPSEFAAAQATRKISTPQTWEYLVVTQGPGEISTDLAIKLRQAGDKGYEACGVSQSTVGSSSVSVTVVLRRPKQ